MKKLALFLGPIAIAAIGYAGYSFYSTAALADYTDKIIDLTAVDAAAGLSPEKQALVVKAIETYVMDIDPPNAEAIMATYKAELAETFIAFSGTPAMATENDYVRIDGPSVWIEFSMQPGRSLPGIHPHSVWRDRKADYGGNL